MTHAAIVVPALCETDPFEDDKEYGDAHLIVVEIVKLMAGLSIIEEFPNALNHAFGDYTGQGPYYWTCSHRR